MKKLFLMLMLTTFFVLTTSAQLYIGCMKDQINNDIQNNIISSVLIDNHNGTFTQNVKFLDGHIGAYTYSTETNICVIYMLEFYNKSQYKALIKDIKKTFKKLNEYKNTWVNYSPNYTSVISTFSKKNFNIVVIYPVLDLKEIGIYVKAIEKTLDK
jgi:hypothetical protein